MAVSCTYKTEFFTFPYDCFLLLLAANRDRVPTSRQNQLTV